MAGDTLANPEQFAKILPAQIYIKIVDYQEKFNGRKRAVHMSILTYFHPVKQKPHLPDPSGPLIEKLPPAAIAAANAKVVEAIDEAEIKKSARDYKINDYGF